MNKKRFPQFVAKWTKEFMDMTADIRKVTRERGVTYGDFFMDASLSQAIKRSLHGHPGWERLAADQKQALEMIATKMARIVNGDPDHIDSWVDIQGYASLVEDRLSQPQPSASEEPSAVRLLTRSLRSSEERSTQSSQ